MLNQINNNNIMNLTIIPSDLSNLTTGENKVLHKIKLLYSLIDRPSYLYIKPRLRNLEPDFILIDVQKGACIIEVKDWGKDYIKSINRVKVQTKDDKNLYNPVFRTNQYYNFAKGLFEIDDRLINIEGNIILNLYSKVIFTNISTEEIDDLNLENVLNQPPSIFLTKNELEKLTIEALFGLDTCYLEKIHLKIIRSILFPEIKIQDHQEIEIENDLIKALDSDQEKFAKRIPYGHYLLSGVPGSGKTVILLSRAIYLLKENPEWNIKIITYNRSLVRKIKQSLKNLCDDLNFMGLNYENISISTFHKLALDTANIIPPHNPYNSFWKEELPLKALENASPTYDAILIDEYQDFFDDWIRLCLALSKKHIYGGKETKNIFLAGDRLQSIYNPNEHTWKSLGINVIGRSKILKHSYRSGKSHIELALDFLMSDKKLRGEVEKFYEGRQGIDNETDLDNEIQFLEGGYDTINNIIYKFFNNGFKPEDVLILTPTHKDANDIYSQLDNFLKSKCKVTKDVQENKINVTTYHSSKGLESKICILTNVDKIEDKKLLYVGMTRASQHLYIHANNYQSNNFAFQLKNKKFDENIVIDKKNHSLSDYLMSFIKE